MDSSALLAIVALVAGATAIGLVVRARAGRVSLSLRDEAADARLAVPGAEVTLLQLSSPVCSACAVMRRVTEELVAGEPSLARRELDVTEHPGLASAHNVLSTPTTLLVDAQGIVRGRIVGAAKPAAVRDAVRSVRESLGAAA
jgi:thioredoxin-related protein